MPQEHKMYVDIESGVVYHKPTTVNGAPYTPESRFYEITEAQAERLEKGETLSEVIREGIEAKIQAEVEKTVKKPLVEPKDPFEEKKEPTVKKAPAKKAAAKKED